MLLLGGLQEADRLLVGLLTEGNQSCEIRGIGELRHLPEVNQRPGFVSGDIRLQPLHQRDFVSGGHQPLKEPQIQPFTHRGWRWSLRSGLDRSVFRLLLPRVVFGVVESGSGKPQGLAHPLGPQREFRSSRSQRDGRPGLAEIQGQSGREPDPAEKSKCHDPACSMGLILFKTVIVKSQRVRVFPHGALQGLFEPGFAPRLNLDREIFPVSF